MEYTGAASPGPPVRRPLWEQPVAEPEPVVDEMPEILDDVADEIVDEEPDVELIEYPDPPRTGDAEVDEAIEGLAQAINGPLEEQLTAFDAAHRTLQARLADVVG
jgi:hypothetical protein